MFLGNQGGDSVIVSGRVGIGGTSTLPLHVYRADDGYIQEWTRSPVTGSVYLDASSMWFGTESNHPIYFFVKSGMQPNMTITAKGDVGIETTVTESALNVQQNGGALRLYSGQSGGHEWIGFYTYGGVGSARSGWAGFGSNGDADFTIASELSGGDIRLLASTATQTNSIYLINSTGGNVYAGGTEDGNKVCKKNGDDCPTTQTRVQCPVKRVPVDQWIVPPSSTEDHTGWITYRSCSIENSDTIRLTSPLVCSGASTTPNCQQIKSSGSLSQEMYETLIEVCGSFGLNMSSWGPVNGGSAIYWFERSITEGGNPGSAPHDYMWIRDSSASLMYLDTITCSIGRVDLKEPL